MGYDHSNIESDEECADSVENIFVEPANFDIFGEEYVHDVNILRENDQEGVGEEKRGWIDRKTSDQHHDPMCNDVHQKKYQRKDLLVEIAMNQQSGESSAVQSHQHDLGNAALSEYNPTAVVVDGKRCNSNSNPL